MPRAIVAVTLMALVAAFMMLAAGVNGPAALGVSAATQQDDAAQIRDLAERLLTYSYPMGDGAAPRAQLFVGRLPADFPVTLPIPPSGRLVGSALRTAASDTANVEVAI